MIIIISQNHTQYKIHSRYRVSDKNVYEVIICTTIVNFDIKDYMSESGNKNIAIHSDTFVFFTTRYMWCRNDTDGLAVPDEY